MLQSSPGKANPDRPTSDRVDAADPSPGTRLDGWKDIAGYLARGERTVKRWEADRKLPIHRVPGGGRASVHAYKGELDLWLKSNKAAELDSVLDSAPESGEAAEELEAEQGVNLDPEDTFYEERALAPAAALPRRGWNLASLLAIAAVALICVAGLALHPATLRTAELRLIPSLTGKPAPSSTAVSIAEQNKAHELYLNGRYEWNQRTPDSLNRALDAFTQAIVHDPSYAQAYVGLADTYDLLQQYSNMPSNDAYARAIVAARKAVALDDSSANAHRALAFAEMYGSWDFADAEKEFRRAIELNPKDPVAHKWYGNAIAVRGRFDESLSQIDKAQELDPTSNPILADKGWMLFNAGRTQEGIALLKEVERSAPDFRSPHSYLMLISLVLHDYPEYLAEGQKAAEITNDPVLKDIVAAARAGYARGGDRGFLQTLYAKQRSYYDKGQLWGTILAKTCVQMGRKQEALQLLDEDYDRHQAYVFAVLEQPDLLTLQDEPSYQALVKKINFPAHS